MPTIRISNAVRTLGTWELHTRTLNIAFRHVASDPWGVVMETLRHEMAHQFADEILLSQDERPHGTAFRIACRKLRCTPTATASSVTVLAATDAEKQEEHLAGRLRKLLALADSPNEFEARAALQKARQLLVKHNLALVEDDRRRSFSSRTLGVVKRRHASYELWLGSLLNRFFFVEVLWQESYDAQHDREGTALEIYGTTHNLDMAEYVHGYLCAVMDDLWRHYRDEAAIDSNRERLRYFAGVVEGFCQALESQEGELARSHDLVWRGDPRLREYYRYVNPRIRTRHTQGVRATDVFDAGKAAGSNVTIRKPLAPAPGGTSTGVTRGRRSLPAP